MNILRQRRKLWELWSCALAFVLIPHWKVLSRVPGFTHNAALPFKLIWKSHDFALLGLGIISTGK